MILVLLYKALAIMAFGAIAFGYGHHVAKVEVAAKELQVSKAAQVERYKLEQKLNSISSQYESLKVQRRATTKKREQQVTRVVERTIYQQQCFDTDGLHIANDAITNQSVNSTEPAPTLPPVVTP